MRGVTYDGERVEVVDDLEVRAPGPDEVRVRIVAAGVCHSDLSVVDGTIPFPSPVVLGHEGAGVVEEVGAAVTSVQPGDRVVLTTLGNCGRCAACERGRPTMCRRTFGRLEQPFRRGDTELWQFANTSVFTETTVVKETQAIPFDARVPFETACLLGCGVLTGMGAVLHRARVEPGETAVVFGVGGIGLNVIQACRLAGAARIVAVDTVAAKEVLAREFGATDFVDASAGDPVEATKDLERGGVDYAFECVGHPAVIRQALDCLDWGGTCVLLGVPKAGTEASFVVGDLYLDKAILGCRYGTSRPRSDIPRLVDLYLAGRLKLDELVSATEPLEGVTSVFDRMAAGELARGVLRITAG